MVYIAPKKGLWTGRVDDLNPTRIHEIMRYCDVTKEELPKRQCTFTGFSSEEGIVRNHGRPGAKEGPAALRQALAKLPLPHQKHDYFDIGDIVCTASDLETAQAELANLVKRTTENRNISIIFGGGHEIAWGHFQGIQQAFPNADIGIVNFDAHLDMRPVLEGNKGTSGTSFLQMAKACQEKNRSFNYLCLGLQETGNTQPLLDTARQYKVKTVMAEVFHSGNSDLASECLNEIVQSVDHLYVTICLDVFAAPFAPGVSAPQPLGLFPWHVIPLLTTLAKSKKVVGLDIAELSPPHDIDNRTANLAAQLVYHYLRHVGLCGLDN